MTDLNLKGNRMAPYRRPLIFRRAAAGLCLLAMMFALALPLAVPFASFAQAEDESPAPAEFHQTFELKLIDGKLPLSQLLGTLLEYAGIDTRPLALLPDTLVDVTGTTGRLTMKTIALATRDIVTLSVGKNAKEQEVLVLRLDRLALREKRAQMQARLTRLIQAWEPQAARNLQRNIGWFIHQPEGKPVPLAELKPEQKLGANGKVIILIHGLDEPGWCWDTIGPALVKEGHTVCEFRYPNDQAIPRSTTYFASQLAALRQAGVKEAVIIAHSMGSLISRDVLTHADYYKGQAGGGETYPTITRLVMLGPPNHGSAAAELRLVGEVREQVVKLFTGDGHLFGAFFDGAGEAKEDLLPGSAYLKELNARPLPGGVKLTILASQVSPVNAKQIELMREKLRDKVPAAVAWGPDQIAAVAANLAEGLGDGAVPVASTKLAGVTDHVMVPGNHSSMLHKTNGEGTALKLIIKRLNE